MTSTLRTLLQELDRPDLDDAAKQIIQVEIEKFLGRNAREVLRVMEASARPTAGEYRLEAHCRKCGIKIPGTELGYCDECEAAA